MSLLRNSLGLFTWPADDTRASDSFLFPLLPPAATMRAVWAARPENPFRFSALSLKFSSRPGVPAIKSKLSCHSVGILPELNYLNLIQFISKFIEILSGFYRH